MNSKHNYFVYGIIILSIIGVIFINGCTQYSQPNDQLPENQLELPNQANLPEKVDLSTPEKTFNLYMKAIETEDFVLMRKIFSKKQQDLAEEKISLLEKYVNDGNILWKGIFVVSDEFVYEISKDNSYYISESGRTFGINGMDKYGGKNIKIPERELYYLEYKVGNHIYGGEFVLEDGEWKIAPDIETYYRD